jgi:uncharacterized protein with FMN-binding domain
MLSPSKKRESLAGKLLLSAALVTVSLAYGWWQRQTAAGPNVAMAAIPMPPLPKKFISARKRLAAAWPTMGTALMTPEIPGAAATAKPRTSSLPSHFAPNAQKSTSIAMAAPHKQSPAVKSAAPVAQPQQSDVLPGLTPSVPLTGQAALAMDLPTEEFSPPLPLVTGIPAPGATPPLPAGTHLVDGDYLSDKYQFEWGDLVVKISIHGGQITGVQILRYPDHRSQSLYLSQMAGPPLESEVIKNQKAHVDAVSSATDTSYAFQDAVANAIMKATRG